MCELLWSDPQPQPGRGPSKRGVGLSFGADITKRFLQENNLGTYLFLSPLFCCLTMQRIDISLYFCPPDGFYHIYSMLTSVHACRFSGPISWSEGWRLWDWAWRQAHHGVFCSKLLWPGNLSLRFLLSGTCLSSMQLKVNKNHNLQVKENLLVKSCL